MNGPKTILSDWIERAALAHELNVTPDTLARWATAGNGPPYVKIGRKAWYRRATVERWLKEHESTGGQEWRAKLKT